MYCQPVTAATRKLQPSSKPRKDKKTFHPPNLLGPLPLSEAGQRLANLFPNGWDWIYAATPCPGTKPAWETIRKYPLSPVELWTLHQDPTCLIGIRPNKSTLWGILDIDRNSPHHNPTALRAIQNSLEELGIVRTLICQSSHSGGLHLYIPLPEPISSFSLAITLKQHLEASGYKLRCGQLESFPNVKRYIPQGQGFSLYNGIRLPFQPGSGFTALDQDLSPLPWTLDQWLNAFECAAASQDMGKLKRAITDAEINQRLRKGDRGPHSLANWQERIIQEKQGWSGPGQTNEKLKTFACEARVFLGMDSEEQIAQHIEQTAQSTPGFSEHSNHQKDLKQRARDVAAWAMRYYWPLGGPSQRETHYHRPHRSVADFSYHQAKREAAQHRIKEAIAQLQQQNQLPATTTARAKVIVQIAKISQHTLYKGSNKTLWHPDYLPVPTTQSLSSGKISEPPLTCLITQPLAKSAQIEPINLPKPLSIGRITQLLVKVGFVIACFFGAVWTAQAPKGQCAVQGVTNQKMSQEPLERGECEGGEFTIANWTDLRKTLPASFQDKIAQAEQSRKRQKEQEQRRRQRLLEHRRDDLGINLFAHPELVIEPQIDPELLRLEPDSKVAEHQEFSSGLIHTATLATSLAVNTGIGRSPLLWEQQEFRSWYGMAESFGLVDDFQWDGLQYWVFRREQMWPYAELAGTFTLGWLRSRWKLDVSL